MIGPMAIERLVLVYDADGGLRGELAYLVGKLRGTAHCSLCDITHGATGEKRAWKECRTGLGVRVEQLHRNELDAAQRAAADELPCVLGGSAGLYVRLLGRAELEACRGDVDALARALAARMTP
jgi:hypothetical protein